MQLNNVAVYIREHLRSSTHAPLGALAGICPLSRVIATLPFDAQIKFLEYLRSILSTADYTSIINRYQEDLSTYKDDLKGSSPPLKSSHNGLAGLILQRLKEVGVFTEE